MRRIRALAPIALSALLLAACSGADLDPPDSVAVSTGTGADQDHAGDDHADPETAEHTETDGPLPRLVVTTERGALVLDASTLEQLGEVTTDSAPRASVAGDDRHVLLVQTASDRTDVLDAGSWAVAHGDHSHYYVTEPALRGLSVTGTRPVHAVSGAARTAIFHDGEGTASVFRDAGFVAGGLDVQVVDSGGPHHGVAVPVEGGLLISVRGPESLPLGVALQDEHGHEVARFETCPDLHGEASTDDLVAFACGNSVLLVDGRTSTTIEYPADDARAGALLSAPGSTVLLGDFGPTTLLLVDTASASARTVDLGVGYGPRARGVHGEGLVLGTDGVLRSVDVTSGTVTAELPVIDPFEIPEGHGATTPQLAVVGHHVVITEPASSRLLVVDLAEGHVVGQVTLAAPPTGVVAVNTRGLAHEGEDDHEHDDHDH